ncbi:MAG: ATP-binding protein [Clostridiales bacterium]|jgi:DNA replication protein DnaC|nr:ATP-binding protein [Clostridiales bacterium]
MSYHDLLEQYGRVRAKETRALDARRAHAKTLDNAFVTIESRRTEALGALGDAVRRRLGATVAAGQTRALLHALDLEEQTLLKKHGLPETYLTLHVRCPLCRDTGFTGERERRICACMEAALLEEQRASSKLDPRETFETFDENVFPRGAQRNQMKRARDFALQYAQSLPHTQKHNLVFLGEAGLGKTFLLNCIAAHAFERRIAFKKATAYTIIDEVLLSIRSGAQSVIPHYMSTPLLLMDDLGAEPMLNNITREYMFCILNERRNGRRHTVIATNLTPEALQLRYGERVFSRLISADDSDVLRLEGQNLRLAARVENG